MPIYEGMLNGPLRLKHTLAVALMKDEPSRFRLSHYQPFFTVDDHERVLIVLFCRPLRLSFSRSRAVPLRRSLRSLPPPHTHTPPLPSALLGNRHQIEARNLSAHAGGFWLVASSASLWAEEFRFYIHKEEKLPSQSRSCLRMPVSLCNILQRVFEVSDKMLSGGQNEGGGGGGAETAILLWVF